MEYDVGKFTSFLDCGSVIIGAGWSTLTSSMVKNMISTPNHFHQKLYGAIFMRQIAGGGDNLAAASGIPASVVVVV